MRATFETSISDTNGGLYAGGWSSALGEHGLIDALLINIDSDGQERWHNAFGGEGIDYCWDMIGTSDKGFALTGQRCREVVTLLTGQQRAGNYQVIWDGMNSSGIPVTSGMYFVRMETPVFTKVNKMTLVK